MQFVRATLRRLLVLLASALAVLLATSALAPAADAAGASRLTRVQHATRIALAQIGDPYRYGAAGPRAFDCSGLIYYSFRHAGIGVPRTAAAQARATRHIRKSSMRRGDLMFFTGGGGVYHAAVFLGWSHGHATMVHSPRPGERVRRDRPWTTHWFAGTLRR